MKKTIIKIQYKYSYLQYVILIVFMLIMLALPTLAFQSDNESVYLKIGWYVFFSMAAFILIVLALIYYQKAEISEDGILIKSKISTITNISWKELKNIRIERLASGTAGVSIIYKEWIVIYTDVNQSRSHGGVNKKSKGPWYIVPTKENIEIINDYAKKFSPKAVVNL